MNIKYIWKVENLSVNPDSPEIVRSVNYAIRAYDSTNPDSDFAVLGGEAELIPPTKDIIPFEELTEELVIKWVKESIGTNAIYQAEEELRQELELLNKPSILQRDLPWDLKDPESEEELLENMEPMRRK